MPHAPPTVETLRGAALRAAIPEVARLRIDVFREWPYLYDGDLDYERQYLAHFAEDPDAVVVTAREDGRIVGAATASPLARQDEAWVAPVRAHGLDPAQLFYFGESVLEARLRGRGYGVAFFAARESEGRAQGFGACLFSAVVRPHDHPLRPVGYAPLDAFWRKRGYAPVPGLVGSFAWKDIDRDAETAKPMQYWMKTL